MLDNFSSIIKILIVLSLITFTSISAQSNIYFYGSCGINYLPMKNFSQFLQKLPNNNIDNLGLNGEVGLRFGFSNKHSTILSLGIINKNASFSDPFGSAEWNIRVFPISIGYNYSFGNENEDKFLALLGLNLSYNFIQIDEKSYSDIGGHNPNDFYKMNKIAVEPNVMMIYYLYKDLSFISKLGYRYLDDLELWSQDLNMSGIILNVGLQIKLFNAI